LRHCEKIYTQLLVVQGQHAGILGEKLWPGFIDDKSGIILVR
jgi:hypothetical protein